MTEDEIKIVEIPEIDKHLSNLSEKKYECIVITASNKEFDAVITGYKEGLLELTFAPAIMSEFIPDTDYQVQYKYDDSKFSFSTILTSVEENRAFFKAPIRMTRRIDTRRYRRISLSEKHDLKIKFNLIADVQGDQEIKDISEGGVGVHISKLPDSFKKDIRLNSIKLWLRESETLHLSGILRYIRAIDEQQKHLYRLGIEFDPLKENQKSTLLDFLGSLNGKK